MVRRVEPVGKIFNVHDCNGCKKSVYTVQYYNGKTLKGNYCLECMTCPICGIDLDVTRLGHMMDSPGFQSEQVYIPAKYCAKCIKEGV